MWPSNTCFSRPTQSASPVGFPHCNGMRRCSGPREMMLRASISHRYAGEPELGERAEAAGTRFSVVAENVAEAPSAELIHLGWMRSEHHRDNLLDPRLDRIAISVLERGGELYAVEDFDRSVAVLSFAEQERAVAGLLQAAAIVRVGSGTEQARQTCALETGFAGQRRPWFGMRFTASALTAPSTSSRRVRSTPIGDAGS